MDTEFKKAKKVTSILRIAARDKENLTSKINKEKIAIDNSNNETKEIIGKKIKKKVEGNKGDVQAKKATTNNKTRKNVSKQSENSIELDLTSDTPSENYWQKLAESYRTALDSALKENVNLHNSVNELSNKVSELEYENSRLRSMHEEAKALVEVLTEMIEQNEESS